MLTLLRCYNLGQLRIAAILINLGLVLTGLLMARIATSALKGGASPFQPGTLEFTLSLIACWIALAATVLVAKGTTRAEPFQLALPLAARKLWLTRVVLCFLAGVAILLLVTLLLLGLGVIMKTPTLVPGLRVMGLYLLPAYLLLVVLAQAQRPELHEVPLTRHTIRLLLPISLAPLALILLLSWAAPPVLALLPLALALLLGWRLYRRVPVVFSLVPREPAASASGAGEPTLPTTAQTASAWQQFAQRTTRAPGIPDRALWRRTVLGTIYRLRYGWVWVIALLAGFYAVTLSGLVFGDMGLEQVVWIWAFFSWQLVPVLREMHILDAFPIGRRTALLAVTLPTLLIVALGLVGGKVLSEARDARGDLIGMAMAEHPEVGSYAAVYVPQDFLEIHAAAEPPQVRAPWGESHEAWHYPLVRGVALEVYAAHGTPPGSSPAFVAYQLARNIERIYGVSIPETELEARYLTERPDGSAAFKEESPSLLADYPELQPRARTELLPLTLLLALLPALLLTAWRLAALARISRQARLSGVTLVVPPLIVMTLFVAGAIARVISPFAISASLSIAARHLTAAIPGHGVTLWAITLLLLAGGFRVLQRRFARVEAPLAAGD